ncbi:MAG: hypothetical protein IT442_10130, partial [Phycisphaeraceae bacterium]|nr:hypothetical protein [Phycisphaeraceae bacterium]
MQQTSPTERHADRTSPLAHRGGGWLCILALAVTAGWLLQATPSASGQERYRLTDKDTWQQQAPPDPASPEGKLAVARKALAEDKPKEALKLVKAWLKENPNHPLAVQAHLLKGDAKTARRDYYKALFDYEYVIRQYPAAEEFN